MSNLSVKCNDVTLEAKSSVKYLPMGVTLDQDLSGITMGLSAVKKINCGLTFKYRKAFLRNQGKKTNLHSIVKVTFLLWLENVV